jgi:serine/threonine-protein kinase RsbW
MSNPATLQLHLNSDPHYLCVVRLAVSKMIERLGFSEECCTHITLAVDEALTNVIRHGYDGRTDCPIWVQIGPTEDRAGLHVVIEDRAKQVTPDKICGRELDDIRPGGLGVHFIHQAMDQVTYTPRPDGGMRLEMIRFLQPGDDQAADKRCTGST